MLEIRPNCEHCGKDLPNSSTEAMICSFECTYCKDCALDLLENVCPSCGGNFQPRPIRPKVMLAKYPASEKQVHLPKNKGKIEKMKVRYRLIKPEKR
ncbi:DUF1272 domain-containing protein [Maribacter aestuarii]|uniref:DUF1272 domain-containing protein n=1 Tax=Maribacter aestuarii TaxID=1130723 RepID=UPI00248CDA98|nr:DUF1272 domain-containing protein [Maribacter aestuarii]